MRNIKRTTRTAQRASQRWPHAGPRDKHGAYRAWQVAESNRRRAIEVAVPFNERNTARPVVAA